MGVGLSLVETYIRGVIIGCWMYTCFEGIGGCNNVLG